MANKPDITPELLRQLIRFDGERYFWLPRPVELFDSKGIRGATWVANWWNNRFAGKETLCAIGGEGYYRALLFGKTYQAHRIIWAFHHGKWPDGEIDHINGVKTDNRLCNLRDVKHHTNSKNQARYATNTSGQTGVCWDRRSGKWSVQIAYKGKTKFIGRFANKADAIVARKAAEQEFGFHANHGRVA